LEKREKEQELAALKDKISRAKQIIIADHTGINVADITVLRRKLKESKSEFRVAKNTLLKLAIKDTEEEVLDKYFEGPTTIVFGYDDPGVPAKIIYDSIKESEKPKFKAYYIDGQVYGIDFLKQIAELPPREVVIAQLIGTVEAPITNFIMVVEAASREFVATLDALAKSKEG
jgi:large subunit ribosomal protein L10